MMRSLIFLFGVVLGAAQLAQAEEKHGTFVGVGSCSSSNCHGNPAPEKGRANILQNEYVTWNRHDRHSKAYEVLSNADSQRIAKHLGIKDPAADKLCLSCHSTVTGNATRGSRFAIEDGVSCEACHGAAGGWLQSHTRGETSHAANVKNGLRDLSPLNTRAELCANCHFGAATGEQQVTHKLIGAGHPRLAFELDTFSIIQPAHWKIDDDYLRRKGPYDPVRAWLSGQLVLAERSLQAIRHNKGRARGAWPELSLFHCYSCHHSLKSDQWKVREYGTAVGEPTLNLSSLQTLKQALIVLNAPLAKSIDDEVAMLHDDYRRGAANARLSALEKLLEQANSLVRRAELKLETRRALLAHFAGLAAKPVHYQYEDAEQLAMAISSILSSDRLLKAEYKAAHAALYQALKNPEEFEAEAFSRAAQSFLR